MSDAQSQNASGLLAALPVLIGLAVAGFDVDSTNADAAAVVAAPRTDIDTVLADFSADERGLIRTHVYGGLPSGDNLEARRGYIRSYDALRRVPRWVAYRVNRDGLRTPDRENRFASFRNDPNLQRSVGTSDYTGLLATRGYARGHLAPFAVMGGDRNRNGVLSPDDEFDNTTVFQANFMSNIAPQHHAGFNNTPGKWRELEDWVRETAVRDNGLEVFVFAGTVFGYGSPEKVGRDNDISVPPAFFKIVIRKPTDEELADGNDLPHVLAFLFPHHRIAHGDLEAFLTSIDVIEALTGLSFFQDLGQEVQRVLEDQDTFENWATFLPSTT